MGSIKELILRSKLNNKAKRATAFVPWDKAKTLALVVDAQTASNKNLLDKFIYETDKVVEVYYLDLKVKESQIKNFTTFTKQHKNLLALPNARAMQKLSKSYDILINAAFLESDYGAVISNGISAKCKCSFVNKNGAFNLIIERKHQQDLSSYLKEVVTYFKMIRN